MSRETGETGYSFLDLLLGRDVHANQLTSEISTFFEAKLEVVRQRASEFFGSDAWEVVMTQTGIFDLSQMVEAQMRCLGLGNVYAPITARGNSEVVRFIAAQFMTQQKPVLKAKDGNIDVTVFPTDRPDLFVCMMQDGDFCSSLIGTNSVRLPDCL